MGNCIGKRNYRTFYFFTLFLLMFLLVMLIFVIVIAVIIFKKSPIKAFDIAVLIVYGILLIPLLPGLGFVAGLWGFHSYIMATNQSTNEYLKSQWQQFGMNPFRR